jgi:SAM-dependent methyltransferase
MHGLLKSTVDFFINRRVLLPEVLELGSMISEDYQWAAFGSFRDHFIPGYYEGIDMAPGRNVDRVGDICDPEFPMKRYNTILCLEVLEHCFEYEKYVARMFSLLEPGGVLVLSTPFRIHLHGYPSDYWRFTPDAHQMILRKYFPKVITGRVDDIGHLEFPLMVFSLAFRDPEEGQVEEAFTALKSLVNSPEMARARELGWEAAAVAEFRLNSTIF